MIPEFSLCICDNEEYHYGLYSNRRYGVVYWETPEEVMSLARKFWFERWATWYFGVAPPTKLLIPGGLI